MIESSAKMVDGAEESLTGVLERITFHSDETGFTVAHLQPEAQDASPVTIVGILPEVSVGSVLEISGRWQLDPSHGMQFKFNRYEAARPHTVKGMERYLGSGLVKGVGPAYAARIVKHFGKETIQVLDNEPERLAEVAGLGAKLVERIQLAWQEQKDINKIMVFLQGYDISASYAAKIYKAYGLDAIQVIEKNPYKLTEDIWGVGFRVADRIGVAVGLPAHDPGRIKAGILFTLNEAVAGGHCFLERGVLLEKGHNLLRVDVNLVEGGLAGLIGEEKIVVSDHRVYLSFLYYAELGVARSLLRIGDGPPPWGDLKFAKELRDIRSGIGMELADEQAEALRNVLENRLAVLTGGPGTGKSTILRALILILEKRGVRIKLAAPTGRAAKRLAETTDREAMTIHRMLGFSAYGGGFSCNAEQPLAADLVIVDEVSMLDIVLANALLRAIPAGGGLLLVGDGDQLPSVGPGNFLRDLVGCGLIKTARLTRIFRQEEGSLISINAAHVNRGEPFDLLPDYRGNKDFYFIARETPEEIEKEVISLCGTRLTRKYRFDARRDIQVLSPMRKGLIGTENLNLQLQEVLNGDHGGQKIGQRSGFRVGDKVMQLRNNYEKEVFNGDLGFITDMDGETKGVTVDVDGRPVRYEPAEMDELQLAYAITIHKSQGSEFTCVVLPVHTCHYPLLQRNLLYTAITRGKRLVVVVGSRKAIAMAVGNNRLQQRNSGLRQRLLAGVGNPKNTYTTL